MMEKQQNNHHLDVEAAGTVGSRSSWSQRDRIITRATALLGVIALFYLTSHGLPSIQISNLNLHSCSKHSKDAKTSHKKPLHDVEELPLLDLPGDAPLGTKPLSQGIPLEAHIMSKCPDAHDCMQKLLVPAMEQISDKVDFKLSFIASVSNKSSDVDCMHGPAECIGNMLMLCAANLPFPLNSEIALSEGSRTPTIRSLGFANCLMSSYERIPNRALVERCAWQHGIDFDALNQCASQQDDEPNRGAPLSGIALLRESALHSAELGVSTSCTLRLDDAVWCVRDGGVWRDCAKGGQGSKVSVLVQEIKRLWDQRN